jgi:hypothetical protein
MEEVGSSEILVMIYKITQRHIPDDTSIHSHCRVNLKSHSATLKMESEGFFEMLVTIYTSIHCHRRWETQNPVHK